MLRTIASARYLKLFLIAYGIQLVTVALFVFRVLPQPANESTVFFVLRHSADPIEYYALAQGIVSGSLPASQYTLGLPLLIVPYIVIFKSTEAIQIIPIFAAIWSLIMYPVGQWLLIRVADNWLKDGLAVVVAVVSWSLLPLALFGLLWFAANPIMAGYWSDRLTWAHLQSDGPATFFTLLLFWGFTRAEQAGFTNRWMVFLGVVGGFLTLVRMTGAIALAVVMGVFVWRRHWKGLLITGGFALLTFLPQLIYNWAFWGTPFQSGYITMGPTRPEGLFNPIYLVRGIGLIWGKIKWATPVAILFALLIAYIGLAWMWKRNRMVTVMTVAWFVAYGLFYGIYYYSWTSSGARFLMPAYPALMFVWGSTVAAVVDWWRARRGRTSSTQPT